jgi:hypothetical protein
MSDGVDLPRQFPRRLPALNVLKTADGHGAGFFVLGSWFFVLWTERRGHDFIFPVAFATRNQEQGTRNITHRF